MGTNLFERNELVAGVVPGERWGSDVGLLMAPQRSANSLLGWEVASLCL